MGIKGIWKVVPGSDINKVFWVMQFISIILSLLSRIWVDGICVNCMESEDDDMLSVWLPDI